MQFVIALTVEKRKEVKIYVKLQQHFMTTEGLGGLRARMKAPACAPERKGQIID